MHIGALSEENGRCIFLHGSFERRAGPKRGPPRGIHIVRTWTNAELQYTYHLEPEEDDKEFLRSEKVQKKWRGHWMQQGSMTRNGLSYSRTDDVVVALNRVLQSASESVARPLHSMPPVDPWTVFWATCKPDP
eukprot:1322707-Pyramimonas_sp.AAC.1